ncbi:hypothetical protein ACFV22_40785, partial [Kitasatospora purpeofusca]
RRPPQRPARGGRGRGGAPPPAVAAGHPGGVAAPAARLGPPFAWARLGAGAAVRRARGAGLVEAERWTSHGRRFLALRRRAAGEGGG